MKNLYLCLLFSVLFLVPGAAYTQQPSLSTVAKITLPDNTEQLKLSEISKFDHSTFKKFKSVGKYKHAYKLKNILFSFEDFILPVKGELDLEKYKSSLVGEVEEAESMGLTQNAYIIKYNGVNFVVREGTIADESFYYFSSQTKNGRGIHGDFKFKKNDAKTAKEILNTFLKGIQLH